MSKDQHIPGPWEVRSICSVTNSDRTDFSIGPAGKNYVACIPAYELKDKPQVAADCRRIVACVNACEGVPTEELEQAPKHKFLVVLVDKKEAKS